jgi:transposase
MITKKKVGEKIYKSAKVVEGYRKPNNKVGHRIIKNLGPVKSEADEKRFRKLVEDMKSGVQLISVKNISLKSSKNYGIYCLVKSIFKDFKFKDIILDFFKNSNINSYPILESLIVNRLENPFSKNKAFEYIQKDYPEKIDCKKDHLYLTMDLLFEHKEKIELEFFKLLKQKLNLNIKDVHYDLTSSYFEGEKCEIALYGYSRDHRKDRKQIVIGLILVDNIPIYHEVFKGNTSDKTTIPGVIDILKNKFNIEKCTIIGDRGMLSEKNIIELETKSQDYILGFTRKNNDISDELMNLEVPLNIKQNQGAILGKEELVEYKKDGHICKFNRKYILCMDKNTKEEQLETLEAVKKFISEELQALKEKYQKSQKQKCNKIKYENLVTYVKKITSRNKKLYNITWEEKNNQIIGFDYKLNNDWYKKEINCAGKFIIITNSDQLPSEILKKYKSLNTVESSFNSVKNQLEIRPINHYKTNRVEAHVFICILALLVEKIIEKKIKEYSPRVVLDELNRIKIAEVNLDNFTKNLISEINSKQKEFIEKLNIIL